MKRKIALAALIAICLSLTAYGSIAYFTAKGVAHNVITTGSVSIELAESPDSGSPGNPVQTDGGLKFTNIMPGMKISKKPVITNLDQPAWIRIKIEKGWENGDLSSEVIKIDIDEDLWITRDPDDGWLYYKDVMGKDNKVSPFREVEFDGDAMDNKYQNQSGYINIIVQAVQSIHNPESGGVLKAAGWPK